MPIINVPSNLDPSLGLPDLAATHCLTLCDDHLSSKTINLLKHTPNIIEKSGLTVWHRILRSQSIPDYENLYVEIGYDVDTSKMPDDLRNCVILAATNGFNAIAFDTWDPESCPHVTGLKTYR